MSVLHDYSWSGHFGKYTYSICFLAKRREYLFAKLYFSLAKSLENGEPGFVQGFTGTFDPLRKGTVLSFWDIRLFAFLSLS